MILLLISLAASIILFCAAAGLLETVKLFFVDRQPKLKN